MWISQKKCHQDFHTKYPKYAEPYITIYTTVEKILNIFSDKHTKILKCYALTDENLDDTGA
jgi:hypothetical protein